MKVLFLGTSCMFPTRDRSQPAVLVIREGDYLLFDCGEGVQRQLRIAGVSPMKINRVFITHWHGDHSLGLPGMIQSMAGNKRQSVLHVYGPEGSERRVLSLISAFDFGKDYDIKVHEIKLRPGRKKVVLKTKDFTVSALGLKHGRMTLGYSFKERDSLRINLNYTKKFGLTRHPLLGELQKGRDITYKGRKIKVKDATYLKKGKKISYLTDTLYFKGVEELVMDSDLLICEATYDSGMEAKAVDYEHLTARQAGLIARDSNSRRLVLTHFSQRYDNVKQLIREAGKEFKEVVGAEDFLMLVLR